MSMPARLGRYAVRRRIGSGGFATVWLAYDEQLDSPVAVKVLAENWTEDSHVRQRFIEEGRFLRKVESPHVVTVYDAGSLDDDRPYLVMTYADQGTLADRLEVDSFTVPQACEVLRQVGEGLQALHERGVLHRDIKPANVLFRTVDARNGVEQSQRVRAMVGDLGLGKALDVSSRLTMIAGTPSFVAPEQAQGEHLDARADQFSLAALAYLLFTGRPPYSHSSLSAAAHPEPPAPMSTDERPFPRAVEDVVRRGLAADREDRFPDVMSFVAALREGLGDVGVGSLPQRWVPVDPGPTQPGNKPSLVPGAEELPEPIPPRTRRRWPAAVLAGALLIGGGLAGWAAWRGTHQNVTFTDDDGTLSVTVPRSWAQDVSLSGWMPPDSAFSQSALSVGDSGDWRTSGQGVFVGLMPEDKLPKNLPQHPSCAHLGTSRSNTEGDPTLTAVSTGCPGVIIERAVRVSGNTLLWVQVRSDDAQTAEEVLSSVRTRGSLG
ncbi:MAG: serine/threonine protein kinase [Nocardioides sp.]|nr:serine/threonine protein kinase [Nocardioides sp.]